MEVLLNVGDDISWCLYGYKQASLWVKSQIFVFSLLLKSLALLHFPPRSRLLYIIYSLLPTHEVYDTTPLYQTNKAA